MRAEETEGDGTKLDLMSIIRDIRGHGLFISIYCIGGNLPLKYILIYDIYLQDAAMRKARTTAIRIQTHFQRTCILISIALVMYIEKNYLLINFI